MNKEKVDNRFDTSCPKLPMTEVHDKQVESVTVATVNTTKSRKGFSLQACGSWYRVEHSVLGRHEACWHKPCGVLPCDVSGAQSLS